MPIYEYHCDSCDATFEKFFRSAGGGADAACPTCSRPARRLLSTFARPGGAEPGPSDAGESGPGEAPSWHGGGHSHGHSHGPGGHTHGPGGHAH